MNSKLNSLICLFAVTMFAFPAISSADEVTCESRGRDKNYCEIDTRGGVRLYKNISKTNCIEGENWGEGRHGVWVSDGCRAVFVSGSRHDPEDYDREDNYRHDHRQESPPQPTINCPPGTHISTHRCTQAERRKGCKDYGGPNGLGCSNF